MKIYLKQIKIPKNNPPYPNIKRLYDNGYVIQYDIGFDDWAVRHIETVIDDALDDSNYDTLKECEEHIKRDIEYWNDNQNELMEKLKRVRHIETVIDDLIPGRDFYKSFEDTFGLPEKNKKKKESKEWVLAYRARYNRWLKEPNRLVVWDVRNNIEKQMSEFELDNCRIKIKYENSIKQEKQCGAKMIIEIYVREDK